MVPRFIQLRNKLNQEQNAKLQQQRECLNKRNSEVAVMDKRVNELRDRLWKKKAALQQKENLPVSGLLAVGGERGARPAPGGRSVLGSVFVVSAWLRPPRRGGAQSCSDVTRLLVPVGVPTREAPVFSLVLVVKQGESSLSGALVWGFLVDSAGADGDTR